MIITLFLWAIIIAASVLFIASVSSVRTVPTLGSLAIIWLSCLGLNRHDTAEVCDTINKLGGNAAYASGQCFITNDGGFPIDKGNSRFIYLNREPS